MIQNFYFNTGVKSWVNSYSAPGDKWINNERHILFQCENVPEGATFAFAAQEPNIYTEGTFIVRPIIGGNLHSPFAYFHKPYKPAV